MMCMREHGTRAEAGTVNIPGDGIAGRGPARLHRRPATDRRKSKGLPGPTCPDSRCAESPTSPRRGEDRREGACGDHGRPPHHAAHLAIAESDRRDHAELTVLAGFDQDLAAEATAPQPDARPASPSSTPAWNEFWARVWTIRASADSWSATDLRRPCARLAAGRLVEVIRPKPRAWPNG